MHGIQSTITAIAVHPTKPILAIAGANGFVILWDYLKKDKPEGNNYEDFSKDSRGKGQDNKGGIKYSCMQFTPDGSELLIARSDGQIIVIDPVTAQKVTLSTLLCISANETSNASLRVLQMIVSDDGQFFACSDTNNCVSLFKKSHMYENEESDVCWWFVGKHKTHQRGITSICFG